MSASARNLEHAAQVQFVCAEKPEQKAEDIQHAPNLLLNSGFERFHLAQTADGAVHYFELGTVRNLSAADRPVLPTRPKKTRIRRIVLWRTMFPKDISMPQRSPEFQSLPKHLAPGSELRNLMEQAIEKIPTARPILIKGDPAQDR